jgi:hypothetical protein
LKNPRTNGGPVTLGGFATGTSQFGVDGGTTTCGNTLPLGANCKVGIRFRPAAKGRQTDTLTINDNATNTPQRVKLSGAGK